MQKFKPNIITQSHQASSSLLNNIKDQQFYSTLSTITLQLAKQAGMRKELVQQLSSCFSKVKGHSNEPMLTFDKQNNHIEFNSYKPHGEYYDSFEKDISLKEQINFINKMESQIVQSRQKQTYTNALKKYASEKQEELLPLLSIEPATKASRFKDLLRRKNKNKVSTTTNYFKINGLELLKNTYEDKNQCYTMLRNFILLKTMFGHSMDDDRQSNCPLYNVLFDQSQKLIISGGQQGAIKIWSKQTGLLLSSLKGHQEFINKLQITKCNKYIYSSAGDGIRFFLLKDMTTLGGWKTESIIDITSIYDPVTGFNKFMFGDKKNLYILDQVVMLACKQRNLTKDDLMIYRYSHKVSKQSYILNIQINKDQTEVLIGLQNGDILLFSYQDLFTIEPINQSNALSNYFNLPVKHHLRVHKDQIRELKWHPNNEYFVSGGKQGFCLLWEYKNQKAPVVLKQIQVSKLFNRRKKRAFGCNFICFNATNTHFIGGFMELIDQDDEDRGNGDIIAYSLQQKQVIFQFSKDMPMKVASVRGMDAHPIYPNIVLVCEGTGRILILDFLLKSIINTFELRGYHLLHPQFFLNPGDCRFSKDGKYFVVSTQFGSISIFGYDLKTFYDTCPSEQFFASDFTPFSLNEGLRPIPIEGELQIDMNRVNRGEIRKIRGQPYLHQFQNNFVKYWSEVQQFNSLNPIDHKNGIVSKNNNLQDEQKKSYEQYLQKIKFNAAQAQHFEKQYAKNLQEIQNAKQSLIYQERQKQSRVFKKLIQEKMKKLRGQQVSQLPELTHDMLLEQIDGKGKRGGRRLTKIGDRQKFPNYKDDNFQYNSQKQEQYNLDQDQEESLKQLDVDVSNSSDEIPRTTRRNTNRFRSQNHENQRHYNIRSRPAQRYNYEVIDEEQQQQKVQKRLKRRTPAEDIQQMLRDQQFKTYDASRGRKKRKLNRMRQDDSQQQFINDYQESESQYGEGSDDSHRKRKEKANPSRKRGRPRRNGVIQIQDESQDLHRLRKIEQKSENSELQNAYQIQDHDNHRNLRNRNHTSNNKKDYSSSKKQKKHKKQDLGECYRCGINPAVINCKQCEQCACCQDCKLKRGKQSQEGKFKCFICIYLTSSGSAILDQKKLSEDYFRFNERSHEIFVPQIDDEVRFFFQGYQEFLAQNIKNLNTEVTDEISDYLLMPHIYNQMYGQVLLQTPLCKVKDIRFFFPFNNSEGSNHNNFKRRVQTSQKKHIHMLINLQVIPKNQTQKQQLQTNNFWIFFIPGPITLQSSNEYLIRQQIYQYVQQNKLFHKLTENQTVYVENEQYQIIQIGPFQNTFPQTIWKQIKISKSDSKRLRNMSKDSQKRCNIWNLDNMIPKIEYKHNYKPEQYQKKILDRIKHVRQNEQQHVLYEDYIDFQIYPQYRKVVQVGICLSSIQMRVKHNFYFSLAGLQFDLDHMVKNSISFNGEDNHITRIGNNIRKQIFKVLNITEDKLNNIILENEQPEKKEKRNLRKKDNQSSKKDSFNKKIEDDYIIVEQPYYNGRATRTRGRNDTSHVTTEKKQESTKNKRKIESDSQFQADFNEQKYQQVQDSDQVKLIQKEETKRGSRRSNLRQKPSISYRQKIQSTTKSKKTDRIMQEYDKQQQVYRNIQNRRNRTSRYLDSSYDSHEKNSGAGVIPTRRSSRLYN